MSRDSLTDSQKDLLRWIVKHVRDGELDEEDLWFCWSKDGTYLLGAEISCPNVRPTTIDALVQNGLLIGERGDHQYKCSLTGGAYAAVDSNFDEPDGSFVRHFANVIDIEYLDPEIRERCLFSLSADGSNPKAWDKAIRTSLVILEERLRRLGNTDEIDPHATGERIVNLLFGTQGTFRRQLGDEQAKAYRDLYSGAMLVFRNRYGHRLVDPSPEEGGAIISFVDLLLKMANDLHD